MAVRSPLDLGLLTEERYDEYINHVMSLPPKRRNKWHVMVRDARGVGRRMYFDGCFKIKTEHGINCIGAPSTVQVIEETLNRHLPGLHPEHPGHGSPFQERIAENHTGNHHRNRTVNVPTAPNQPVRR
jgi:hypothetical protein